MFGRTDIGSLHITFSKPESVFTRGLPCTRKFLAGHPYTTDIRLAHNFNISKIYVINKRSMQLYKMLDTKKLER